MTAEKKARKPLQIKNLVDLKRHIKLGTEFVATEHRYHPDTVRLSRVVTKVQTNGSCSKLQVLNLRKNDGSVLYEMELYDGEQNMAK